MLNIFKYKKLLTYFLLTSQILGILDGSDHLVHSEEGRQVGCVGAVQTEKTTFGRVIVS